MLLSLAYIFIFGIFFSKLCAFLKIPDVVGMIFAGIVLNFLNVLDISLINISGDLRQFALIIILTRAGLSLDLKSLKKVGKPAILMSFLPALFEISCATIFSALIFDIPLISGLILGCVITAVSPAIIVPRMIKLQNEGFGTEKNIPKLILCSASIDDILVIILFYSALNFDASNLFLIPVNIVLGVAFGVFFAILMVFVVKKLNFSANHTVILMLSASFCLLELEKHVAFSALLSIMIIGMVFYAKIPTLITDLSNKFNDLWACASIILFVLVGYSVDVNFALAEGIKPVILLTFCLVFRSIGTFLCLIGSNFNKKERLFCVFAYLPKATVQAGIGTIPLALGVENGELILTMSVVSILITAPLGAFLIDNNYKKLLQKN